MPYGDATQASLLAWYQQMWTRFYPSQVFPLTVHLGDSLTAGGSRPDVTSTWPICLNALTGKPFVNTAVSGRTWQAVFNNYDAEVSPYAPRVTGIPALATLLIGTNNFGPSGGTTAEIYAGIKSIWARLRSDAFYILALPPTATVSDDAAWQARRVIVDGLIAGDPSLYDAYYPLTTLLPDPSNLAYFDADGTHYVQGGNDRIAAALFPFLKSQFNWP